MRLDRLNHLLASLRRKDAARRADLDPNPVRLARRDPTAIVGLRQAASFLGVADSTLRAYLTRDHGAIRETVRSRDRRATIFDRSRLAAWLARHPIDPADQQPITLPPLPTTVATIIAAIERSRHPVTLAQVYVSGGGAYSSAELASAMAKLVNRGVVLRQTGPRTALRGRRIVNTYTAGPQFEPTAERLRGIISRTHAPKRPERP